ncbi:hypothetical protein MIR68_003242 [Amoeboaphelidium protococcarum]|nr:hypothetical protein MIR68_003242 [Amoeboaphelidium protococcarum]
MKSLLLGLLCLITLLALAVASPLVKRQEYSSDNVVDMETIADTAPELSTSESFQNANSEVSAAVDKLDDVTNDDSVNEAIQSDVDEQFKDIEVQNEDRVAETGETVKLDNAETATVNLNSTATEYATVAEEDYSEEAVKEQPDNAEIEISADGVQLDSDSETDQQYQTIPSDIIDEETSTALLASGFTLPPLVTPTVQPDQALTFDTQRQVVPTDAVSQLYQEAQYQDDESEPEEPEDMINDNPDIITRRASTQENQLQQQPQGFQSTNAQSAGVELKKDAHEKGGSIYSIISAVILACAVVAALVLYLQRGQFRQAAAPETDSLEAPLTREGFQMATFSNKQPYSRVLAAEDD